MSFLGGWYMAHEYFEERDEEDSLLLHSMARFGQWLHSGIMTHTLTRTLLGGPLGVKWPVLILARAYWTGQRLKAGWVPAWANEPIEMAQEEFEVIEQEAIWLMNELQSSTKLLSKLQRTRDDIQDATELLPAQYSLIDMWVPEYPEVGGSSARRTACSNPLKATIIARQHAAVSSSQARGGS